MSTSSMPQERKLNDYESMLVTSTCSVAVQCLLPIATDMEAKIRDAWADTKAQRGMLQVRLEATGTMGGLGPRYKTTYASGLSPIQIVHQDARPHPLLGSLQRQGTFEMDISKSTYVFACTVSKGSPETDKVFVTFCLTLCHAVSDGPGTLHVLHDFLTNLQARYEGRDPSTHSQRLDLIDIQAKLLGESYGAKSNASNDCYKNLSDFQASLANNESNYSALPPEALQHLPTQTPLPAPCQIQGLSFSLDKHETANLRSNCRELGGTIQGGISVACLAVRLEMLNKLSTTPILCALQIPVNTRPKAKVPLEECLCGSAGVWHTITMDPEATLSSLVSHASDSVRDAVQNDQHVEWLRRLFNDPATLPPYSLMVSSIGVAPIQEVYGDSLKVLEGTFFGGSMAQTEPNSNQATMVHVTTFADQLQVTFNFTTPGINDAFAHNTVTKIHQILRLLAADNGTMTKSMTLKHVMDKAKEIRLV